MALLHESEGLVTAEELACLPDLGPCELVNGKIIQVSPASVVHGVVEARVGARLSTYADEGGRGVVLAGEAGLLIRRNPDTVRGADLVFISQERYARCQPGFYVDIAPEFVVEVLSPGDRRGDVQEKLSDYFEMGVDLVWVIDPKARYVLAYRSLFEVERIEIGDLLMDEEILPGLSVPVADLFRQ